MSVTQQQVLDALARVTSPRGVALTNAGVLSAISASDGKVFFSINVDAAEARAWESIRAAGRSRGARHSRRRHRDGRTDGRTQGGSAAAAPPAPHRACSHGVQTGAAHRPPQGPALRRCRGRRKFPAFPPSSRWPPARAASANRPPRSISRSGFAISACASACSMPISTGRRCRA